MKNPDQSANEGAQFLTAEQEFELWRRMEEGRALEKAAGADAAKAAQGKDIFVETRNRLIMAHEPLLRKEALRWGLRGAEPDELFDKGFLALCDAVDGFDPSKGRFAAYARKFLRGIPSDHQSEEGPAVLPDRLRRLSAKVRAAEDELVENFHRRPTDEEIAERLKVPADQVRAMRQAMRERWAASMEAPIQDGAGQTLGETLRDHRADAEMEALEQSDVAKAIDAGFAKLRKEGARRLRRRKSGGRRDAEDTIQAAVRAVNRVFVRLDAMLGDRRRGDETPPHHHRRKR